MYKTLMNWSGGKDSALSLYRLQQNPDYQVQGLLTTINQALQRVTMHGVRRRLLEAQAQSLGLPLRIVELPESPEMDTYGKLMKDALNAEKDISHAAFGDIFLEDLKAYREKQLQKVGLTPVFPIWQQPTKQVIKEFLDLGFKAVVVCVNAKLLSQDFVGRELNRGFIQDLPDEVDPCGENGEFHSFVYDGPNFEFPITWELGDVVEKNYGESADYDTAFYFGDLV